MLDRKSIAKVRIIETFLSLFLHFNKIKQLTRKLYTNYLLVICIFTILNLLKVQTFQIRAYLKIKRLTYNEL